MLCKLLKTLNANIIRENLLDLALLECLHLYVPLVLFSQIVIESGARIDCFEEFAHSLSYNGTGLLVESIIANHRRLRNQGESRWLSHYVVIVLLGWFLVLMNLSDYVIHHVRDVLFNLVERVNRLIPSVE